MSKRVTKAQLEARIESAVLMLKSAGKHKRRQRDAIQAAIKILRGINNGD